MWFDIVSRRRKRKSRNEIGIKRDFIVSSDPYEINIQLTKEKKKKQASSNRLLRDAEKFRYSTMRLRSVSHTYVWTDVRERPTNYNSHETPYERGKKLVRGVINNRLANRLAVYTRTRHSKWNERSVIGGKLIDFYFFAFCRKLSANER